MKKYYIPVYIVRTNSELIENVVFEFDSGTAFSKESRIVDKEIKNHADIEAWFWYEVSAIYYVEQKLHKI